MQSLKVLVDSFDVEELRGSPDEKELVCNIIYLFISM